MSNAITYQLEVAWYRICQMVLTADNYFMGYRLPEYIEGPGSIKKLPDFLREKGADDVLVVTARYLMQLGLPKAMLQAMEEAGIRYTCFSEVGANPTTDEVEKGYRIFQENGCKAIVAFGGGTPSP